MNCRETHRENGTTLLSNLALFRTIAILLCTRIIRKTFCRCTFFQNMLMTAAEQTLWEKLQDFPLDDPAVSFSFSDRLARENGWGKAYALRVAEEYKRFLFLCCVCQQGVTPSDPVDQAWHLHLTYTRSYWIDLCRNTLGKEIHHNPTKGGLQEAEKFHGFYTTSHLQYKEKFGAAPPPDIWHNHHTRFTDIHFQRVNVQKNWIIKKPSLPGKPVLMVTGMAAFAALSIQAFWDVPNLLFLGFLAIVCIAAYRNRGKGGDNPSGCTMSSCGTDSSSGGGHHSDSGCCSGCSGCSSGCSGCGGD